MKKGFIIAVTIGIAVIFMAQQADAIPAFARKYQTSCQTCHVAFPELTPFGEGFKRNGLRFPDDDAEATKDEPVSLGAESYKKVFPEAVWPGEITGHVPFSAVVSSTYTFTPEDEAENIAEDHSFEQFGASLNLLTAGTLGDRVSFWGGVVIGSEETEIERAYAQLNLFPEPFLNVKIGQFEPGLTESSIHRSFLPGFFFFTRAVGDNEWTPEPSQQGIEVLGILGKRFGYNAGIVEGRGNAHNKEKDFYVRLEYKFGGLNLDGSGGKESEGIPKPWRDDSIMISGFGYWGHALVGDPAGVRQEDRFSRVGFDVLANYWDLRLKGGYAFQINDQPVLTQPGREVDSNMFFLEGQYLLYPWLIPAVRYEQFDSDILLDRDTRLVLGVIGLVRANVRLRVSVDMQGREGGNLETESVAANIALVF